jgi:hypothetical protein
MGDLSGAVQWWDEWKLHVLVFASLGIQYFLTIFACGRKFSIPSWFRFVIWLSYLGGVRYRDICPRYTVQSTEEVLLEWQS